MRGLLNVARLFCNYGRLRKSLVFRYGLARQQNRLISRRRTGRSTRARRFGGTWSRFRTALRNSFRAPLWSSFGASVAALRTPLTAITAASTTAAPAPPVATFAALRIAITRRFARICRNLRLPFGQRIGLDG